MTTGWDTGLCQDYCRGLSLWFASRIDARWTVRRWFGDQTTTQHKDRAMQSDKELLMLAAKAAGIDYDPVASFPKDAARPFFGLWLNIKCEPYEGQRRRWNPLTDDGDALRLAVKLGLSVYSPTKRHDYAFTDQGEGLGPCAQATPSNGDPYAATRRAIVSTAASLAQAAQGKMG